MTLGRPVATSRAVMLFSAALVPAVLTVASPRFAYAALAWDCAIVLLCGVDFFRAPAARSVRVERSVEPILSSGVTNRVRLRLESALEVSGELRDGVPLGMRSEEHRQRWALGPSGTTELTYGVVPPTRGDFEFGDVHIRLPGPLGLCCRQHRIPLRQRVKVYPDLTALVRDGLAMSQASRSPGLRSIRRRAEGTEFESLREYRPGDDYRTVDWKATARRGRNMVRNHQPERNQSVMLMLDCGRSMAGVVDSRRKLDHAVDAALRLAQVCLKQGDQVGVAAFAQSPRSLLLPRKGLAHLRSLTEALYQVDATLDDSDYGRAFDLAFARQHKRTLVIVFTDLLDPYSSAGLVQRAARLRPRHLPLIASLLDPVVLSQATAVPTTTDQAYQRHVAARLEDEYRHTVARLRDAGVWVIRERARSLSSSVINEYLRIKSHGLL